MLFQSIRDLYIKIKHLAILAVLHSKCIHQTLSGYEPQSRGHLSFAAVELVYIRGISFNSNMFKHPCSSYCKSARYLPLTLLSVFIYTRTLLWNLTLLCHFKNRRATRDNTPLYPRQRFNRAVVAIVFVSFLAN